MDVEVGVSAATETGAPDPPGPPYRSLSGPADALQVLLVAMAGLFALGVAARIVELSLVGDLSGTSASELLSATRRLDVLQVLTLAAAVPTVVVFLAWFRRAYGNLAALGATGLRFGTGWALGAWLIPVANLVLPALVAGELWRETEDGVPEASGRRSPVGVWWALLVAGSVLASAAAWVAASTSEIGRYRAATVAGIVAGALLVGAALVALRLVGGVSRTQGARALAAGIVPPAEAVVAIAAAATVAAPVAAAPPVATPAVGTPVTPVAAVATPVAPAAPTLATPPDPVQGVGPAEPSVPAPVAGPPPDTQSPPLDGWPAAPARPAMPPKVDRPGGRIVVLLLLAALAAFAGGVLVKIATGTEQRGVMLLGWALAVPLVVVAVLAATGRFTWATGYRRGLGGALAALVVGGLVVATPLVDHCDLREPDSGLQGCNLAGVDLAGLDLSRSNLSDADLTGANLEGANLFRATLKGATLAQARAQDANLSRANLDGADLAGADLGRVGLIGASLKGAKLHATTLDGADLTDADLSGADLDGAHLRVVNAGGATLAGAHLIGVDLHGATLTGATFVEATLEGVDLGDADLTGAHMARVTMTTVVLSSTKLADVTDLDDKALSGALRVPEADVPRKLVEVKARFEASEAIASAVEAACRGQAVAGTRANGPPPQFNGVAVVGAGAEQNTGTLPKLRSAVVTGGRLAPGLRYTALVVCLDSETGQHVEICPNYTSASTGRPGTVVRQRLERKVRLVAASSGAVVAEKVFVGTEPRGCNPSETFSSSEADLGTKVIDGTEPSVDEIRDWVVAAAGP